MRDAAQQHGVELARDLDVVRRPARAFAQRREIEPDDALATPAHGDLAALDLDVAGARVLAAAQLLPAPLQPGVAVAFQRRAVHRRAGQRAHAVVLGAFGVQLHTILLQQGDGRQEAVALQAVEIQVLHRGVGGGHQGHAFGEQPFQQARQQHRVADVGDEELVQHQHPQPAAPFLGDLGQRVALALVFAQALVDAAHEAVEVGAVLLLDRQAVVEQVDQEGLAAADAAPEIQALDRPGLLPEGRQPVEPAVLRRIDDGLVDAVQFGQCRVLGRIVAPVATGHAGGVALRGGRRLHAQQLPSGSQRRTSCWIAPRRSISLRWKKWLVSGMRTS